MRSNEQRAGRWGKAFGAAAALALALGLPLWGCGGGLGSCTVECTFLSDGAKSFHGPYDDYTEDECDDQAKQSESPTVTTCEADFDAY